MSRRFARLAALVALALVSVVANASADPGIGAGLWPATHKATSADCGPFGRDANGFCNIDDNGSVELGVKFTSSKAVDVVGVRAYRVDGGPASGSLWTTDGSRLAGPSGFAGSATHAWQDVAFGAPVAVVPGRTYIASHLAPDADYAFEWSFFTAGSYTAGPIIALQSVVGDPNGVYCYGGEPCAGFPTNSFRDTNYWVTPLWAYRFAGFFQPVDNATWNGAKAGSAIPVKFGLGGDQGLAVLEAGFPRATQIACPGDTTPVDAVEQTVAAGASGLSYDAYADQYVYVWKTSKSWAGKCYRFELGLEDDTSHAFDVRFR